MPETIGGVPDDIINRIDSQMTMHEPAPVALPEPIAPIEDNPLLAKDELPLNETARRTFAENTLAVALNFIKNPSRRARVIMGLVAFLGGAYLERDEILQYGSHAIMHSVPVMHLFEAKSNAGHILPASQTIHEEAKVEESNDKNRLATLDIKDNHFNIYEGPWKLAQSGKENDSGPAIEIKDPYLKNVLAEDFQYVRPPADSAQFDQFLIKEINTYTNKRKDLSPEQSFGQGNISEFLDIAQKIVDKNMHYDDQSETWLKPEKGERMSVKWGQGNPISALYSTDNTPVDRLLMEKHYGLCRDYADCLGRVTDEIKRIYPGKFQNIYVRSFGNSYQWHAYNLVFVVANPQEVDVFDLEPQTGQADAAAYEVVKMMRDRNIITNDEYLSSQAKFLNLKGAKESAGNTFALLESALRANRQDVVKTVKEHILRNGGTEELDYLKSIGLADDRDYARSFSYKIENTQHFDSDETLRYLKIAEESKDPLVSREIISSLRQVYLHPDFSKFAFFNYRDIIDTFHQKNIISEKEYIDTYKIILKDEVAVATGKNFLNFILTKPAYAGLAKDYLSKDFSGPVKMAENFLPRLGKGEFRNWDKQTLVNEAYQYRAQILLWGKEPLARYEQLTGENLAQAHEKDLDKFFDQHNIHLTPHFEQPTN